MFQVEVGERLYMPPVLIVKWFISKVHCVHSRNQLCLDVDTHTHTQNYFTARNVQHANPTSLTSHDSPTETVTPCTKKEQVVGEWEKAIVYIRNMRGNPTRYNATTTRIQMN